MQLKKAFTLFELLIVVTIIGVVYTIFTQKLSMNKTTKSISLKNFIPWIMKQPFKDMASVVCLFDETEDGCRLYLDNKLQKDNRLKFFKKFDDIKVYRIKNDHFEEIDFFPFVEEEIKRDVFFRLHILPNGGFKTTILQKNNTFFFYNSFDDTLLFDSVGDIEDYLWEKKKPLNER